MADRLECGDKDYSGTGYCEDHGYQEKVKKDRKKNEETCTLL